MNPILAYEQMFRRWRDNKGVTARRDYWTAILISAGVGVLLDLLGTALGARTIVADIYYVIAFVPMLNMTIRRLSDAGHKPTIAYIYAALTVVFVLVAMVGSGRGSAPELVNTPYAIALLGLSLALTVVGVIAFVLLVQRSRETDGTLEGGIAG